MRKEPLRELKPGARLALPVVCPREPDICLLNAGAKLTRFRIEALASQGIEEVWIETDPLRAAATADLMDALSERAREESELARRISRAQQAIGEAAAGSRRRGWRRLIVFGR